ncbi:chromatin assembly factor 1 subunit B [Entomortierella parvispora]|uniref:Chromatin assembly factor 1 subunit B n=1 Tax=Entomortierella parvispora TaxID=205924 RepID=A0A9P3HJ81_9FUNG|nr:chromatin assembly factor 1 subunit B [Entomortierella parvispora]
MKVKPLQIHWHDKQPIYSAHFEPGPKGRLATAGGDCNIRIWKIDRNREKDSAHVDFLSSLNRHSAAVNVVRFSPTSECLASAGDDGNIILWRPTENKEAVSRFAESDDDDERETWRVQSVMRGSLSDIYDLAWSPDGKYIISGSIDNTARIWDIGTSKCLHVIADHHHYVQGVAWDPLGEFVATQSSDRSVHVYSFKADKNGQVCLNLVGKSTKLDFSKFRSAPQPAVLITKAPVSTASTDDTEMHAESSTTADDAVKPVRAAPKSFKTYHDETLTSFFRRLSFTPDGAMLLVPAGQYKTPSIKSAAQAADDSNPAPQPQDTETRNTSYIYARRDFGRGPVAHLPGHKKPSVAIKCSPILYELRKELLPPSQHSVYSKRQPTTTTPTTPAANQEAKPPSVFGLAYRSVYAVATQDSILIYDTQQTAPLALVSHLHYATYTDMAWSGDGCNLIVASSDGFCSLISFEEGELGTVYKPPQSMADLMGSAEINMVVTANESLDPAATIAATAGMMQKLNGLTLSDIKELKEPKETKETKEPKGKAKGDKSSTGTEGKKALVKKLFSKANTKSAAKTSAKTERDGDAIMTSPEDQPSPKKRKIQPTFVSPLPGSMTKSPSTKLPSTPTTPTTPAVTMEPAVAWNSSPSSAASSSPPTSGSASPAPPTTPATPKPKKRIQPTFVSALP